MEVAVVITAVEEEVRESRIKKDSANRAEVWDGGQIKQAQDFHSGNCCLCPV